MKRKLATALLAILSLSSCEHEENQPKLKSGDIVRVKLTGERLSVIGHTNRFGVYDRRYDLRNHTGHIREMMAGEVELDMQPENDQ